jgi:hypothetical protein
VEDSGDTFDEERPVSTTTAAETLFDRITMTTRRVRAAGGTLSIGDTLSIARSEITNAFMRVRSEKYRVVVDAKSVGRVRIETSSREESERLLHILGFGITEKKAVFRVLPSFHTPPARVVVGCAMVLGFFVTGPENFHLVVGLGWMVLGFLLAASFAAFRRTALVGRDGITLTSIWRKRFIPYRDIAKAALFVDKDNPRNRNQVIYSGVEIRRREKPRILLPTTRGASPDDDQLGLLERIDSNLSAWRAAQPIDSAMLDRAERSTEDWLSALRRLGEANQTTYRVAAVDREALFAIVEDPANQAVSRVAAAIAIGAKLDDEARARLRASAAAIADPKLRVAIEHVAEEKEDELNELLDDLAPLESRAEK